MNVIVISLDRAQERRKKIIEQFEKLNISDYYIMSALDGSKINHTFSIKITKGYSLNRQQRPAEFSCGVSHIMAINYAKMMKWKEVLILEDDVVLCDDFLERYEILKKELPFDWELAYLGVLKFLPIATNKVSSHLYRSNFTVGGHSYLVRNIAYTKIINYLSSFCTIIDDMLGQMIEEKQLIAYTFVPFFTYQGDQYSYLWDTDQDSKIEQSNNYFKPRLNAN